MFNYKKFIFSTISFFVLTMAMAYPWHLILFHEIYVSVGAVTRPEPIIPFGMLAVTIQGAVIAYLYPYFYRGGHPIAQGVKFSLIMGLMVYTVMIFATAAKMQIEPVSTFIMYGTAFSFIHFTVTGVALGLIYGRKIQSSKKEKKDD